MANIKFRPNAPNFDELYTGVTDDSMDRICSSIRSVSKEAQAYGVGSSGVFEDQEDYDDEEEDFEPMSNFDFDSDEERKLAELLSQEEPEAELNTGSVAHYLYPEYGTILSISRHNGSVNIETFDYEDDMYQSWERKLLSSRVREY